jgi:hypothetical protein
MIIYRVGTDSLEKTDISGVLSARMLIEKYDLCDFEWELDLADGADHPDFPEVRRYLCKLLEEWPGILRHCGPWAAGMFVAYTCELGSWNNDMALVSYSPLFLRVLNRAGLREDHIF